MANATLTNDSTPTLDWADVSGANLYHAQVSLFPNFSTVTENSALGTSTYTPSISTNNRKYYWRWRSSTDGGTTWGVWSARYSFWYYSSFTGTVTPTTWMFVNPAVLALTDKYSLSVYPEHRVTPVQINRSMRRSLLGAILYENVTVKDRIELMHDGAYITQAQRDEIDRFYQLGTTFFLCASISNETENVENVWKVTMPREPEYNVLAPGREALFRTSLYFEEV